MQEKQEKQEMQEKQLVTEDDRPEKFRTKMIRIENEQKQRKREYLEIFLLEHPSMKQTPRKIMYDYFTNILSIAFDIPKEHFTVIENAVSRDLLRDTCPDEFRKCKNCIDWIRASSESYSRAFVSLYCYIFKEIDPYDDYFEKEDYELKAIDDLVLYLAGKYGENINAYIYRLEAICDLDPFLFEEFSFFINYRIKQALGKLKEKARLEE